MLEEDPKKHLFKSSCTISLLFGVAGAHVVCKNFEHSVSTYFDMSQCFKNTYMEMDHFSFSEKWGKI